MLEQRRAQEKGYITLKEAAKLFSYSPDYIGQLIRSGKIEGEQVYANVAWVTTEEAVLAYVRDKGKKSVPAITSIRGANDDYVLATERAAASFGTYLTWLLVVFSALAFLVVVYIFSITLDQRISAAYVPEQALEAAAPIVLHSYDFRE